MSLSDEQLRQIVDVVFVRYDNDNSGALDREEVKRLVADVFTQLDMHRLADPNEIDKFINSIDKNGDGLIQKPELFDIFKEML